MTFVGELYIAFVVMVLLFLATLIFSVPRQNRSTPAVLALNFSASSLMGCAVFIALWLNAVT